MAGLREAPDVDNCATTTLCFEDYGVPLQYKTSGPRAQMRVDSAARVAEVQRASSPAHPHRSFRPWDQRPTVLVGIGDVGEHGCKPGVRTNRLLPWDWQVDSRRFETRFQARLDVKSLSVDKGCRCNNRS